MTNYAARRSEIDAHPQWAELSDAAVAAEMAKQTETVTRETRITKRTLMQSSVLGLMKTVALIEGLNALVASEQAIPIEGVTSDARPLLREIRDMLDDVGAGGLDIADTQAASMLTVLRGLPGFPLTDADAAKIVGLAIVQEPRWPGINWQQVKIARSRSAA